MGLRARAGGWPAGLLVIGVRVGTAAWWLLLRGVVARLRDRFDTSRLRWINRFSGTVITAFGAFSVWRALASPAGGR